LTAAIADPRRAGIDRDPSRDGRAHRLPPEGSRDGSRVDRAGRQRRAGANWGVEKR
jgi:hypothetical protein